MTHLGHKGDMTVWPDIACRRGCAEHIDRRVEVRLGGPTRYGDLAPIPDRLARSFAMRVWDPAIHPVDGGPYCPAHDAVSETIVSHRVWEPRETILTLSVLRPSDLFIDIGAQIGWFTMLALSAGARAIPIDADAENLRLLAASVSENWPDAAARMHVVHRRIGPESDAFYVQPVRLAKIDVEGAEDQAVRCLWPIIEAGLLDHLLIEMSPVFADYYGDLAARLIDAGFDAFLLPPKQRPPVALDDPAAALAPYRLKRAGVEQVVNGWHQENVWFKRTDAAW